MELFLLRLRARTWLGLTRAQALMTGMVVLLVMGGAMRQIQKPATLTSSVLPQGGQYLDIAYSPVSSLLACAVQPNSGETQLELWDTTSNQRLWWRPLRTPRGQISFTSDGARVAWIGQDIWQWETASGTALPTVEAPHLPLQWTYNSDGWPVESGRYLSSSTKAQLLRNNRSQVWVYDADSGERLSRLSFPTFYSVKRRRLLSRRAAGSLSSRRVARLVGAAPDGNTLVVALGLERGVASAAPPDSNHLTEREVWLCDAKGRLQRRLRGPIDFVETAGTPVFSSDGRFMATVDSQVRVWDLNTGRVIRSLNTLAFSTGESNPAYNFGPMIFSADGSQLFVCIEEIPVMEKKQHVVVWNFTSGAFHFVSLQTPVRPRECHLAVAPDNRTLAVMDSGATSKVQLYRAINESEEVSWTTDNEMSPSSIQVTQN